MSKIDIISASAGSGKTHRLTELLKEEVGAGRARPGAIVATTFTKRAAAELQERVRTGLLKAGRIDDAQVLSTSRIGTVNSVCGGLVSSFAFVLGLPVHLRVLDEEPAELVLKRVLSQVVTVEENDELAELKSRWVDLDWEKDVENLVKAARSNGISDKKLAACAERSKKEYRALLGEKPVDASDLNRRLEKAVCDLVEAVEALRKPPKKATNAVKQAEAFVGRIRSGNLPSWREWLALSKIDGGVKVKEDQERLCNIAREHDRLEKMAADAGRIIDLVFSIASRSLEAYRKYKADLGLIDFVDQEVLALELLQRKDVQDRLRDEIDLVLVDEFQDTSPLQLAVFLALARLSKRSVWVGDQKQAIYGFRGTDPRLMDDAIHAILGDTAPETLGHSYRSRPELVRLTSDVFQDVFWGQKIPRERVRLEPAEDEEPEGLGPIVERWILQASKADDRAAAIAAGIRALLSDPKARVRVKGKQETRNVRPGDVAVLCRSNVECRRVADSLESIGVRAAIPRTGLLQKPEARVVVAGLRLWFDPKDSIAAAEILRLTRFAESPNEWLKEIIDKAKKKEPIDDPHIRKIAEAKRNTPLADPLQVFDAVVRAVDARELCLGWGDSDARLSNLDALRQHVVGTTSGANEQGFQGSLSGLLAWLARLAADDADGQATVLDDSAVKVSTWHKAKGLEWPFVVVHSLDSKPMDQALGVKVIAPDKKFDVEDPLAGRWIRYWPFPYSNSTRYSPLNQRLSDHKATKVTEEQEARERLRLLYVCWTRARDRLILPAPEGALTDGILDLLQSDKQQLIVDTDGPEVTWAGRRVDLKVQRLSPQQEEEHVVEPGEGYAPEGPKDHPPAWENPSDMKGEGTSGDPETIGDGFKPKKATNMKHLGDAIHGFFAADIDDLSEPERLSIAEGLLERWEVAESISPADLLKAGDALKAWIEKRWPDAKWHREIPMTYRKRRGSIVRGICDLVLQTEDGWVVIDHKSYQSKERVADAAPQLKAYADGIEKATGKRILGRFVHLPLAGLVVPIKP
jgi:ATP-dependent helicase/nuclease subunit A